LIVIGGLFTVIVGVVLSISMQGSSAEAYSLIGAGVVAMASGLINLGIAQVVDYLGRSAHSSMLIADLLKDVLRVNKQSVVLMGDLLKAMNNREESRAETRVDGEGTRKMYRYAVDGMEQGPFSAKDMREFKNAGVVKDDTPVYRDGDSDWRTYHDFPNLA